MTSALHAEGREFDSHWKYLYVCPRGPTDKASDYESGDCGFESHRGCFLNNFHAINYKSRYDGNLMFKKLTLAGLEPAIP